MGNIGRPLLFETPQKLEQAIDGYINTEKKPTLAGLAYHLGIDRHTLYNYKEREDFFHILKKATDFVQYKYEERLIYESNPTGVIFALKNMGWSDKQEIDQKTTVKDERIDDSKFTDEELRVLAELQRKGRTSSKEGI